MGMTVTYNNDVRTLFQTFYANKKVDLIESLAWLIADEKSFGVSEEQSNLIVHLAHFYFDVFETLNRFTDWFLPSDAEVLAMYDELHLYGLGNFTPNVVVPYISSSEIATLPTGVYFDSRTTGLANKSDTCLVRPCRMFTSTTTAYSIRDVGPAGGYIFAIDGTTYFEAAPYDLSPSIWSNITTPVGGTDTILGSGQANTTLIINQVGHITSAAKLCDDYDYWNYLNWLTQDEYDAIMYKRTILEY